MKCLYAAVIIQVIIFETVRSEGDVLVETNFGKVRGKTVTFLDTPVFAFLGIPYAQPPVGDQRFKAPSNVEPWSEVYNATEFSHSCFQPDDPQSSEDCLYLNIWSKSLPPGPSHSVVIWLHSGGLYRGSASGKDGKGIAALGDVVFVSLNYRLGPFGFLATLGDEVSGNMAIYDQVLAIMWVKENIDNFGGNAGDITLMGHGTGARLVHLHTLMFAQADVFRRAIMMSGTLFHPKMTDPVEVSIGKANKLAKALNCLDDSRDILNNPKSAVACLRNKPAKEILDTAYSLPVYFSITHGSDVSPFYPILMVRSKRFKQIDLLIGSVTGEGSSNQIPQSLLSDDLSNMTILSLIDSVKNGKEKVYFNVDGSEDIFEHYLNQALNKNEIREAFLDYIGDSFTVCPIVYLAEHYSQAENDVYLYRFSHRSAFNDQPEWLRAPYKSDQNYTFGYPLVEEGYTDEDKAFTEEFMKLLFTFAKTGNPGTVNGIQWPKFTRNNPNYVDLNGKGYQLLSGLRKSHCDYMRKYFFTF